MIRLLAGLWLLCVGMWAQSTVDESRLQAVEAWAQALEAPPRIILNWPARADATGYQITRHDGGSWSVVASLGAGATSWTDANVTVGQRYEYRIVKNTDNPTYIGQTYITAGIRAAALQDGGLVLLVIRDNLPSALGPEINQLRTDLMLEGYQVAQQTVSGGTQPAAVRQQIQNYWQNGQGGLKAVMLLGNVPVPYSGAILPDGHSNHFGAWPADGFYADLNGTWTDSTVNTTVAERQENWNVPGDGKFDQNTYPSAVDVPVGRIDLSNMTCYSNKQNSRSEIDLMRQYLNKDHQFRSGNVNLARRGLVLDNFGLRETNGVAATAYRNFASFFGAQNVAPMDLNTYFSRLSSESALCTWGAGGGSYYYCSGVGTSDDFALTDVNVVFSLWLGSYFGDWNNESNWLRAALGSGKILVSVYAGIPHSLFHNMALGGTIGDSFVLTQNNKLRDSYYPDSQGLNEVHQALLGDPTLRLFPRGPLSSAAAQGGAGKATISWTAPSDSKFLGVHIYRTQADAPWTRITSTPATGGSFADNPASNTYAYLVRPVWLETTGSGTFENMGQGTMIPNVTVTGGVTPPPTPPILTGARSASSILTLQVVAEQGRPVIIERSDLGGSWSGVATNSSVQGAPLNFDMPIGGEGIKIFRARY